MEPLSGSKAAMVAAIFAALSVARYAPVIDAPWEASIGAYNASLFAGEISRHWSDAGFFDLKGMPCTTYFPASPPIVGPYLHHPPAYQWAVHGMVSWFGRSERSFRIVPILGAALGVFFTVLLAGRLLGLPGAVLAGLAWLCAPMSLRYDWMPNPESLATGLIAGGVYFHWRRRDGPAKRYGIVWLFAFLACQADWQGAFLGPSLVLMEAMGLRKGEPWLRRMGRALSTAAPIVASVAVTAILFGMWTGSLQEAVKGLIDTKDKAGWDDRMAEAGLQFGAWAKANAIFISGMYTGPLLAAASLGALAAFRSRTRAMAAAGCALALPGFANIAVFGSHSAFHEFWSYYTLPGIAFLFALACMEIPRRIGMPAAALILAYAAFASVRLHLDSRTDLWKNAGEAINSVLDAGDILLVPPSMDLAVFYVEPRTFVMRRGPVDLTTALHVKRERGLDAKRLVLLLPPETPAGELARYREALTDADSGGRVEIRSMGGSGGQGDMFIAFIE